MNSLNSLVAPSGQRGPSPQYWSTGWSMKRGVARIQPMFTRGGGTFWILSASLAVFCYLMLLDEHSVNHFRGYAGASPDPVESGRRGVVDMMNDVAKSQGIIVGVVTLWFARLADAHSRELVYGISLFLYVLGHILGASARYAGGDALVASMVFHVVGQTGLRFVTDVVLADITSLQWRGFAIALPMLPYTLNAYVAAQFALGIINGPGWAWGYGIFAITVPVALAPSLLVLSSTSRRQIQTSKVEGRGKYGNQTFFAKLMSFDPIGSILIAAIFGLVSYPPQLVPNSMERLSQPKLVAMVLVGTCCIPLFLLWEWFNPYASLIPKRFMTNRAVICAILLGFFTRLTIALRDMHAAILVVILNNSWSSAQGSWFISMLWASLTFFAVVVGLVIRAIHRFKYVTFVGVLIRLVALGMQIGAVTPSTTTARWFAMEGLAGLGGACIDIGARVGSQASVSHNDLAMVVAIVRLSPLLGASFAQIIGTAVIQADPVALAISQSQYFGQDPGIGAYQSILRKLFIIAFCLSIPCIIFALFLPNPYLGNTHNLVDSEVQPETTTTGTIPNQDIAEKGDEYSHPTTQP